MKPLVYERIVPAALAANRERGGRKAIERDIELTRRRIAAAGGRVPDGLAARLDGLMVCLRLLDGLESIRNNLAVTAKDRALTQADVDAHAASYVFGERTARRRTNDPVEAEALELARRLVRKKGQSMKENTEAARELLRSEKGDPIRAQAAKRVADPRLGYY